jgi:hypothetical protein
LCKAYVEVYLELKDEEDKDDNCEKDWLCQVQDMWKEYWLFFDWYG